MMVVNGENSHSNAYPETANSRQAAHTGAAPSMAHRTATSSDMRMVDHDSRFWDEYTPISTGIATARTSPAASMAGCVYGSEQIVSGAYGEGLLAVGGMELAACPVDVGEDAALADIQERGYLVGG